MGTWGVQHCHAVASIHVGRHAFPLSDSIQMVPVWGVNFCWYDAMELEPRVYKLLAWAVPACHNQSAVWTRWDRLYMWLLQLLLFNCVHFTCYSLIVSACDHSVKVVVRLNTMVVCHKCSPSPKHLASIMRRHTHTTIPYIWCLLFGCKFLYWAQLLNLVHISCSM